MTTNAPGPWKEIDQGWIDAADGTPVVEYRSCGSHAARWASRADYRLALAAPEMLDALLQVADLIKESFGVHGLHRNGESASWGSLTDGEFDTWLGKLYPAITKAQGESR